MRYAMGVYPNRLPSVPHALTDTTCSLNASHRTTATSRLGVLTARTTKPAPVRSNHVSLYIPFSFLTRLGTIAQPMTE